MITVIGIDPGLRGFGMVRAQIFVEDDILIKPIDLLLVKTENTKIKQVRASSDNLRRAQEIQSEMVKFCKGASMAFAEIPSGGQSAKAVMSFGIQIGVLASCPIPLCEVQPNETKLATVGTRTASKEEMIEWATTLYPLLNWHRKDSRLTNDNEHLADATAILHAGVKTKEFQRALALYEPKLVQSSAA